MSQQHASEATLGWVGPGQSLGGRPDAAGSGVGGPVGGTFSSGKIKKQSQYPRAVIGDIALCILLLSFGCDVKWVS